MKPILLLLAVLIGTAVANTLSPGEFSLDAKDSGLGRVGVLETRAAAAQIVNPAMLGLLESTALYSTLVPQPLMKGTTLNLGGALKLGKQVGLGVQFSYDFMSLFSHYDSSGFTPNAFTPSEGFLLGAIGVSPIMSEHFAFSLGLNGRADFSQYASPEINSQKTRFDLGAGLHAALLFKNQVYRLALSAINPLQAAAKDADAGLTLLGGLGCEWTFGFFSLSPGIEASYKNQFESLRASLEIGLVKALYIRGGFALIDSTGTSGRISTGLGLHLGFFSVDVGTRLDAASLLSGGSVSLQFDLAGKAPVKKAAPVAAAEAQPSAPAE